MFLCLALLKKCKLQPERNNGISLERPVATKWPTMSNAIKDEDQEEFSFNNMDGLKMHFNR